MSQSSRRQSSIQQQKQESSQRNGSPKSRRVRKRSESTTQFVTEMNDFRFDEEPLEDGDLELVEDTGVAATGRRSEVEELIATLPKPPAKAG